MTSNLDRVWVDLIPGSLAHYRSSLNACVIDERFVLDQATTVERIASTIVHEATHARLEAWGIVYVEQDRSRIERICMRRELNFLARVSASDSLQAEIGRTIEWYDNNHNQFSDTIFQDREEQGAVETLRHLSVPNWVLRLVLWVIWRRRMRRFTVQAMK
ncbi:hypothetical protein [Bradyrhizobium macuxiense]|uniref:hypothetical protein n=1 Tax=Bradyrhizobium macuxiense TaxID=1755647 RepID=UPI0010A95A1A|nr:hypothetical protein [Bradyrhizobium macuxiense]